MPQCEDLAGPAAYPHSHYLMTSTELNEVASAAIRSANRPIRSLQARATAAGFSELIELRNSAALRFAPGASPEGAIIQLARIEACKATMLKSKISTLTPNAPLGLGSRG